MKYYAVKKGRNPGIYTSREACQKEVTGFPGAVFKSFKLKEEAEGFMRGGEEGEDLSDENTAIAYVDGSFNQKKGLYGSGVVFITGERTEELSETFDDSFIVHRNVAGEVRASELAIKKALEEGFKKVVIHHDYQGIASRAKGDRKANNGLTQAYRDFCREAGKKIQISFVKVKAHSNDKYNDLADKLAKKAVGLE